MLLASDTAEPAMRARLEEEVIDGYDTTLVRLKFAGLKVKWPLKQVYTPVKKFLKRKTE